MSVTFHPAGEPEGLQGGHLCVRRIHRQITPSDNPGSSSKYVFNDKKTTERSTPPLSYSCLVNPWTEAEPRVNGASGQMFSWI